MHLETPLMIWGLVCENVSTCICRKASQLILIACQVWRHCKKSFGTIYSIFGRHQIFTGVFSLDLCKYLNIQIWSGFWFWSDPFLWRIMWFLFISLMTYLGVLFILIKIFSYWMAIFYYVLLFFFTNHGLINWIMSQGCEGEGLNYRGVELQECWSVI